MGNRDKTGTVDLEEKSLCEERANRGEGIHIFQVDAFTCVPLGGNPAGVVLGAEKLSPWLMQKMAQEMNLSETAFVKDLRKTERLSCPGGFQKADFEVRFFTPKEEVQLCGHATLAAFWLLAEKGEIRVKDIRADSSFEKAEKGFKTRVYQSTRAGVLPVDLLLDAKGGPTKVMMTQPLPQLGFTVDGPGLLELEDILGAPFGSVSVSGFPKPQAVSTGLWDLMVPVASREALWAMRPDMDRLKDLCEKKGITGVHCFCMDTLDFRAKVHCRNFAPLVGIPEEAATGTASGALGAYLVLKKLIDVTEPVTFIRCEQGHVMGRSSVIDVKIGVKKGEIGWVRVGGRAVTVMEGVMKPFLKKS